MLFTYFQLISIAGYSLETKYWFVSTILITTIICHSQLDVYRILLKSKTIADSSNNKLSLLFLTQQWHNNVYIYQTVVGTNKHPELT